MRRYYHTTLAELTDFCLWEVAAWIEHLPPDSAVRRADGDGWSITDHLLAGVVDALNGANWQRANSGAAKVKQSKYPAPIPRPGDDQRKADKHRTRVTGAALLEFRRRNKDNQ